MATVRMLLGIFCLIAFGCRTEPDSGVLAPIHYGSSSQGPVVLASPAKQSCTRDTEGDCFFVPHRNDGYFALRAKITTIAASQIGVREATGNNDGTAVEMYLKVTNLPKGYPWCAAFVSWVFKQIGYSQPRTAWSPSLFPLKRLVEHPEPADVLGIYSLKLKRIAHCGLVERIQNNWIISIEGNTNLEGSREGDGVYRKWRHKRTINKFANWIK